VAAPLVLAVTALFIRSNNGKFIHGWLWEYQNLLETWPLLLLFYAVEFGAYVACCPTFLARPGGRPRRIWLWAATHCLLLLPLYRIGQYCDFPSKAAIPSLLILQVFLATTIRNATAPSERNQVRILTFLLLIGTFAAIYGITQQMRVGLRPDPLVKAQVPHIDQLLPKTSAEQLFSDGHAFFWRFLARPAVLR
jgi:hypothetical protein